MAGGPGLSISRTISENRDVQMNANELSETVLASGLDVLEGPPGLLTNVSPQC